MHKTNKTLEKWYKYTTPTFHYTHSFRRTSNTRGVNRGFTPENPLFTLTVGADTAKKYYERLGIKFFPTRYQPLTMLVYIT